MRVSTVHSMCAGIATPSWSSKSFTNATFLSHKGLGFFTSSPRSLSGMPHALVDVSHRQFALEVSGPHAATILSGACPLDLDIDEFPAGMCTRTVLAKADIVLWRTRGDAFHLEAWRSFSGYVTGLLREIAGEFYAP